MNKTLIVDDMQVVYDRLRTQFPNSDYSSNLPDALKRIETGDYNQVITDYHLGDNFPTGGLDVIRAAVKKGIETIISMSSQNHEKEALEAGANEFHFKRELLENGTK